MSNKRELKQWLKANYELSLYDPDYDNQENYRAVYIGSFLSLDPCGRYHHILSPNGATSRCIAFWERLECAASELGGWIESGEGDPLDQYFCMPIPDYLLRKDDDK